MEHTSIPATQLLPLVYCTLLSVLHESQAGVSLNGVTNDMQKYSGASANVSTLLDSILLGYDKRLRPNYKKQGGAKGPPVEIGISMHVYSISSISEVDMDFTVDMFFRQHWSDNRLTFEHSEIDFAEDEELCITQDMLDRIWWPDTYFANAKSAKFHYATTKNAFFRIHPSGRITQSLRLTVTAMCGMDLTFFPMDTQVCKLGIESYGYSTRDIDMIWQKGDKSSVAIETDVQLPQFQVVGYRTTDKIFTTSTGNYTRLYVEFLFQRSLGYYIIQIYIPSCLIVVLSWMSFWLSREAVPARVALGITTVLTMTTLISSTNAALPKISYLKSIDIFLIFCFFMVFMSLIEYAFVSYMANRYKSLEEKKKLLDECNDPSTPSSPCVNGDTYVSRKQSEKLANYQCQPIETEVRVNSSMLPSRRQRGEKEVKKGPVDGEYIKVAVRRPRLSLDEENNVSGGHRSLFHCTSVTKPGAVDKYSRVMFPLVFIVFNLMYWLIYLNISQQRDVTDFL